LLAKLLTRPVAYPLRLFLSRRKASLVLLGLGISPTIFENVLQQDPAFSFTLPRANFQPAMVKVAGFL
jgi:hypothetical protein